jgi:phage shock protein PspC (stress-responsive transcriptional regulator)
MSDITTADPQNTIPTEAERKLVRPAEGRVVAGVAAGLARYFGISPVVYRVAFAALVLLGGSGLILYAAAWLVIPDEQRGESVVEEAIRHRRDRPWLVIGVGLVGLGLILGIAGGRFWTDPNRAWLPAIAVGLAILWWQLPDRFGNGSAAGADPSAPEVSRRRRPSTFPVVIGILVAGAGVLGALQATDTVDVNWTLALAGGVVLVGVGIAAGAFFGGVRALAALGALLAAILVAVATVDVPLHGPIGDRTVHPTSVRDLHDRYRQAIGSLELDLRNIELPAGKTNVTASVGIGQLTVRVPEGVRVEVDADVTAGETRLFGSEDDGWNVDHTAVGIATSADAPTLVVHTDVGFGQVEVTRR